MSVKQQLQSSSNYEDQLKILIKSRKQIVEKMSHLTKKRYFLQAQPRIRQIVDQVENQEGQPRKMAKLQSKQSLELQPDNQTPKKDSQRVRSSSNLQNQEQQSESIKKMKEQNTMRSKKMFQGLVSHLDKAKNKLQQEKSKRQETNKIYQKIQEKQRQKSEQLLRQELDKINTEFLQQQKLKNENSKQILKIQNLILLKSYTQYANSIRPFTFTRTQPSILWKTTKDIQKTAKILLSQREKEIEEKNKKIMESIQKYENKFEYGTYFLENEKQYYSNYINSYYQDTSQFIRTETQPPLLWKPAQDFQKVNSLITTSNKKIQETTEQNRKMCQEYYTQKSSMIKEKKEREHHLDQDSHEQTPPHKQEQD